MVQLVININYLCIIFAYKEYKDQYCRDIEVPSTLFTLCERKGLPTRHKHFSYFGKVDNRPIQRPIQRSLAVKILVSTIYQLAHLSATN